MVCHPEAFAVEPLLALPMIRLPPLHRSVIMRPAACSSIAEWHPSISIPHYPLHHTKV